MCVTSILADSVYMWQVKRLKSTGSKNYHAHVNARCLSSTCSNDVVTGWDVKYVLYSIFCSRLFMPRIKRYYSIKDG